jgi:prophage regulatory protein
MLDFSKLQIFGVPMASFLEARAAKQATAESHTPSPRKTPEKQSRLLTFNELKTLKGISYTRQHIERLEKANKFPQRIKIGARVYWYEHEIDEWIQSKADAR